jgi:hypothetical protein
MKTEDYFSNILPGLFTLSGELKNHGSLQQPALEERFFYKIKMSGQLVLIKYAE